jgi:hypothetical protein
MTGGPSRSTLLGLAFAALAMIGVGRSLIRRTRRTAELGQW